MRIKGKPLSASIPFVKEEPLLTEKGKSESKLFIVLLLFRGGRTRGAGEFAPPAFGPYLLSLATSFLSLFSDCPPSFKLLPPPLIYIGK